MYFNPIGIYLLNKMNMSSQSYLIFLAVFMVLICNLLLLICFTMSSLDFFFFFVCLFICFFLLRILTRDKALPERAYYNSNGMLKTTFLSTRQTIFIIPPRLTHWKTDPLNPGCVIPLTCIEKNSRVVLCPCEFRHPDTGNL